MAGRLKRYSHRLDSLEILNDMRNNHILLLLSAALLVLAGCLKEPGPADIVPLEETFTPGTASAQWQRLLLALQPQSG